MAELVIKLVNGELAGKTMQQINKDVNAAAQALKKAEVGTKAWVDAHARLEDAKKLQGDLKKQIDSTTSASDLLKRAWNNLPGAQFFNQIADSFGMLKGGVGGLTSGFKILKFAIAATGLGLLVILLGSLFAWFQKTERGADFLSKAMAAAGAAVNVLIDRASKLIDALIAFTKGDWSEAAKKFGEATADVTEEIKRETQAAWELADALDQLEELEGKLILIRSRTREQVAELRLLAKDETKSIDERSKAIQKAIQLTQQLNQEELEAAKGRIMQALQVTELSEAKLQELIDKGEELLTVDNLGLGESTQEDLNKAFEAIAKYNDIKASSFDQERALVMELNKLRKKDRSEEDKAQKERRKAEEEEYKAIENLRKLEAEKRLALISDEREKEIEALNIATEEKITALQGSEAQILEQIKLLRDIQGAELAAIDKKWADKKVEEDKKAKDEQAKRDKELADNQKKLAEDKAQFEQEMADVYRDVALDSFGFATEMSAKLLKNEADAKRVRKAGAILEIGINLQREMAANAANAAANPLNATTFGAAGAAQLTASNLRSIIRAAISTAKVIAFRKGGVLKGPSHENNGIPFTVNGRPGFEAEGGEIILTKGVYRNPALRRAASAINVMGGGRKFAAGGPVDPFVDRAPVNSGRSGGSESDSILDPALADKMDQMISLMSTWPKQLKVVNVVTETEEGIRTANQIREDASV